MEEYNDFDKMGLKEELLRGVYAYGFEKPSAIQSKAIIPIANGHDTIAQAQSGTGKTATFSIGVLQRINVSEKYCQALLLSPTRELVDQTIRVILALSDYMNVHCHACVGGRSIKDDMKQLTTAQIVVGTPGRVIDMLQRNYLSLKQLSIFVLDEADEMLSIGFKEQIYTIFDYLPNDTQVCLFSATMPHEMISLSNHFMRDPVTIRVNREEITLEGITQYYINIEKEDWKFETLCDLYGQLNINQALIYCNKIKTVQELTEKLNQNDFSVSAFHAELSQSERDVLMREFRSGKTRVLVTTDILSRGIDIQQVSMVFNYDLPFKKENYIHRIGRSGRFGRQGIAINFVTNDTISQMQFIQKFYDTQILELPDNLSEL